MFVAIEFNEAREVTSIIQCRDIEHGKAIAEKSVKSSYQNTIEWKSEWRDYGDNYSERKAFNADVEIMQNVCWEIYKVDSSD